MSDHVPVESVLFVTCGLRIDGGIASVARTIARVLDEQVRAGGLRRVDRLSLDDTAPSARPPAGGVEYLAAGSRRRFALMLHESLRRHRHDLVLFDHYGPSRALDLPLSRARRVAIFTHAIEIRRSRLTGSRRRALNRAQLLLANSAFSERVLREHLPELRASVTVVHLCIDPERERRWASRGEPDPLAPRERAVLCAARMSREDRGGKGIDDLLACWPRVRDAAGDVELWIAGQGDALEDYRARAGDGVHFLGQLDEGALGDRMRRASLFAMPSRQEGFGLVFAEAMWHGLPCIGTTADAAGEVIADDESGRLVPFGDPRALGETLAALLADEARRRELAVCAARQVRERFGYPQFRRRLNRALGLPSLPESGSRRK